MNKKYIVRLSIEERGILEEVIRKLKASSAKVRRAHILLKSDAEGLNWSDKRIAEALSCSRQTAENIREGLVTKGFKTALNRRKRETPPRKNFWMENSKLSSLLCD